jgi:hypothetical protein
VRDTTDTTIPDIALRTTSDGQACTHSLAIGTDADAGQAVTALMDEARRQAHEIEHGPARAMKI